jgi:hypothetical protein
MFEVDGDYDFVLKDKGATWWGYLVHSLAPSAVPKVGTPITAICALEGGG